MDQKVLQSNIEKIALEIGFSKPYVDTLLKISKRKRSLHETSLALEQWSSHYKKTMQQYNKMKNDPISFYQTNKKLRKTDNDLLTYGSLSLSYSFCSPYRLITTILNDSKGILEYHKYMVECSDENHVLEDFDNSLIEEIRTDSLIEQKYQSFMQDLRGNKVSLSLLNHLLEKVKFDKRDSTQDNWGLASITRESLIDSFYIFFGSKRGTDFIEEWVDESNHEKLKDEFEYLIYNNPYINPLLVSCSLEDFMTKEHIESTEYFLNENKGRDRRIDKDECVNFGLSE